jgi:hypothetical protein
MASLMESTSSSAKSEPFLHIAHMQPNLTAWILRYDVMHITELHTDTDKSIIQGLHGLLAVHGRHCCIYDLLHGFFCHTEPKFEA